MRFSTATISSALTALTFLVPANARIAGVAAPAVIAPGTPFVVQLLTENYIQTVYDVSAAFGLSPAPGYQGALGTTIGSVYIGPGKSNILEPLNFTVSIDSDTIYGQKTLTAAVMSLYGVSSSPALTGFNVTVTVGKETSTDYVQSSGSIVF
ncbi:uncharacterized protein L3040_009005 [Drepanopeziza brunnea f. sp. 'multigermtubi']|uniref:Secreted protein NIS1 n=1 Tax=Marssonina brunnea f. sp. multigermtubi (strain MB_m1) TaxID=1072389 RepID=K1W8S6_MARBU|nr:uncharacterized protein MBM_08313 [Drepanopeziza brunnea f. sp. 'multigermtubi' MB_m1]EKD13595.1 hypothetical protein MBM_08313 [Drepanopeziza brunnea f. sp. 'multigermtubi' MB_m1]KAJ5032400.1 hypothetical protein L3040_009005 [Drepanopeziza brunnea f. sp. 'multigermtubi']